MPLIKSRQQNDYSDLDLFFVAHPATGDVPKLYGEDAIRRSVRNLILTNFYDRPFRSNIGSNIRKTLFDNITEFTSIHIQNFIEEVINNWEPRVELRSVVVSVAPDSNAYIVNMLYKILNRQEPVTNTIILKRLR